jgi:hypothetical protein
MNSPVQVVLNAQNYVRVADVNPGGGNKDFYADRDQAFVQHRDKLVHQVLNLERAQSSLGDSEVLYAHVALQADAWAKSHRPISKIFSKRHSGNTFGGPLGSIVVELTPAALPEIAKVIASAEPHTTWGENKEGKRIPKPSRERSEVGAIESIRLYSASDRRGFSLEQAIKWLSDQRTGASYYVETFISQRSIGKCKQDEIRQRQERVLNKFKRELEALNLPIQMTQLTDRWDVASLLIISVNTSHPKSQTDLALVHEELIRFLDVQPVVRAIVLPPVLQAATVSGESIGTAVIPPPANAVDAYPVVGVIDSGVSEIEGLNAWSAGSSGMVFGSNQETDHGTFIAGLICGADAMNSHAVFQEEKCRFFDLGLHPTADGAYGKYYPRGFVDFLEQLDAEIPAAKKVGVRIFNMSLAVTTPVADATYSIFANLLDEIADRHDVLFVLPAGNLNSAQARDDWPVKVNDVTQMLANYPFAGQDRIFQPGDSIRSLVVGAVNPPDKNGDCLPARYTRRGPGPSLGAKPDICHIGGKLDTLSGLCSVSPTGNTIHSCGTSYAAPLAAKTLAAIEKQIVGGCTRESLLALAIHHAELPSTMVSPRIKQIAKDFVGAGMPRPAANTLVNSDSDITLVFSGVLHRGEELRFSFAWPKSLVDKNGGCSGAVKVTLVHRPPIDREHAGEFVRVNLDAYLRQEMIDVSTGEVLSFKGRLKPDTSSGFEKERVKHGAKWWPVKRSSVNLKNTGNSSQWRLVVDSLSRSEYIFPNEGVPFSVLMTISDSTGQAIFDEMRQQLQVAGTQIEDIRTDVRSRVIR